MKTPLTQIVAGAVILSGSALHAATDLTLHLTGSQPVTRITAHFACDAQGVKMGLPVGTFAVEYVNGAGNSLAILPINGSSLIFANVMSGSGARYAASQYIWWDASGRSVSLSSSSLAGQMQTQCHPVDVK